MALGRGCMSSKMVGENGKGVKGLFAVELRLRGLFVGVHFSPDERVEVSIYRFRKDERNKLQYLKVKWYRVLEDLSVLKLGDKYVVSGRRLPELEEKFRELYREFESIRNEIVERLRAEWSKEEERLRAQAEKLGVSPARLERLKPDLSDSKLLEMEYTIAPLPSLLEALREISDQVEELAKERDEYRALAERLRRVYEEEKRSLRESFEKRVTELEEEVKRLRSAVKVQKQKIYELALKANDLSAALSDSSDLFDEGSLEDMKTRLDALISYLSSVKSKS